MNSSKKQIKKILHLHQEQFIPVIPEMKFHRPQQLNFLGLKNCSHVRLGLFYELMTCALFGGKLIDSIIQNNNGIYDSNIKPDVINKKNKTIYESKAIRLGQQLNLFDFQIIRYKLFQIINPIYKTYFAIWRHDKKAIKSFKGTNEELYQILPEKTKVGIIISFDIILKIWQNSGTRYETDKWDFCTKISSTTINNFIFDPEQEISNLGLNPNHYLLKRYITPKHLKIEEEQILPFPIITIDNKNYTQWAKELSEKAPF